MPAGAQQRPTPAQAQELLRTRPDLAARVRQYIRSSGLTPDQVRARLRAEGYPETLLDAYFDTSPTRADSTAMTADVFAAVESLGLVDSLELAELRDNDSSGTPESRDRRLLRRAPRDSGLPDDELGAPGTDRRSLDSGLRDADTLRAARGDRETEESRSAARGTEIFGLRVFRNRTSQFQPTVAGPVDPSYRLGPGDELVLILTGDVELSHSLRVTREGFVVIPQVGQIYVNNLTLQQLDDLLYTRLGRVYSGVRRGAGATTRFSVSVARLRSNQVFVFGDVERPGSYQVSSAGTALTALYAAGGPSDNGSLRSVEIRRGGRAVQSLDVYDYLLRGDASHDARLETGDIVFVPVHGPRVQVTGEVVRPAVYEVKPGETLRDVLRAAGGFSAEASRRRVQIERILAPAERTAPGRDRVVIDIADEAFADGTGPSFPVEPGDLIRVFRVAERVRDRVTVLGNVWSPGPLGFRPGMTLSEALKMAGGVKPDVYLGQILISRLQPDSTRVQLRSSFLDSTGAVASDLPLREDDEVEVFAVREFRPKRYVVVSGAVRYGGRFPYREGMTVRDLVLLGGGLEESAYLREAEIARLPEQRDGGITARTFRVPLDSSYLFERGPDGKYLGPPGLPAPRGDAPEIELKPYDNVLILRQPDWELHRTVLIAGEVRFPGRYTLTSKSERLSELIARAGGLTTEAYPEGVVFYRRKGNLGRIGIDLPRALSNPQHRDNLMLQDSDSIYLPTFSAVVNVTGAVNSPVAVAYVPGRDIDFYISAAGGLSKRADERRSYVTQPNGKVESRERRSRGLFSGLPKPRPGSTVFVPEKDPNDRRDWVAAAGAVAQVLASIVALVVVITR